MNTIDYALYHEEIKKIPSEQVLNQTNKFKIFYARAGQIPHFLQFIGARREINFRSVGEGTGKEIDLDEFDEYYYHVIIWDIIDDTLIGACRLGDIDKLLKTHGVNAIYSNTLFEYKDGFFAHFPNAIEVSRVFIEATSQKKFNGLQLIWNAILHWSIRNSPCYWVLGCVSISQACGTAIRDLLVNFCREKHFHAQAAAYVQPRICFESENSPLLNELSLAVNSYESFAQLSNHLKTFHNLDIPVLFKKYELLSGRYLAFSFDPSFSNATDSLVCINLRKINERMLRKVMGSQLFDQLAEALRLYETLDDER